MNEFWQAVLSYAIITVLIGFFLWALCRVLDRNCDSNDFGYSKNEFDGQIKRLQRQAEKDMKRRKRMRVLRLWNF